MIEWFARNSVAANLLMVTIVITGVLSAWLSIPLEVFPSFERQIVVVDTNLRGATPHSVEDAVTTRIEEAIFDLEGIEKLESRSSEGLSKVIIFIEDGYNKREMLNDIKLRVDSLNTLPVEAETPIASLSRRNEGVLQVAVLGDVDQKTLRKTADRVREDLLSKSSITLVELLGVTDYEISIELSPKTLERFGLSLSMVAEAIRQGSVDLSAGNVKTRDGDVLIRTDGQAYNRDEYARIPIITTLGADPVLLGDIATIVDGFEDRPLITKFDGKPAVMIDVLRTGDQSALEISKVVRDYIDSENRQLINTGLQLEYWDDDSKLLKSRLSTLINSGLWGGLLVLILLSLFLRPAVAFWVFLGVPVSFMGALIFMPFFGGTFNVISLFAFITVLGIVVDDAIVTGENIYRQMRDGVEPIKASIIGTKEIAVPVTFGILTTIVAFFPLSDLGSNRVGFFARQIPLVVIPVLLFSLIESKLVLPSHLSHVKPRSEGDDLNWLSRIQMKISRGFEQSITRYYEPFLRNCLNNKALSLIVLMAVSSVILTSAATGFLKFTFFPRIESEEISFSLVMPDTTGFETTQKHVTTISDAVRTIQDKYRDPDTGISIIRQTFSTSGTSGRTVKPSVGSVRVELIGPEERHVDIRTSEIAREIRQLVGDIPGAQSLNIRAELGRGGEPIDIEINGLDPKKMRPVGDAVRAKLREYPNVFDIQDNYSGGKEELNIELKPRAFALGLSLSDIASQVRGSVFGLEAQRIQRGPEEVRVMVRLPLEDRSSIEDLLSVPIRVASVNTPIPLSDLVTLRPASSPTTLFRLNRSPIINITADVDKTNADVPAILAELRAFLDEEVADKPDISYTFKGESEEQAENNEGLISGLGLVLISIYALLAIPFKSYLQPLIVMSIIPFSAVGAMFGHIVMLTDLSILSIVGIMALLGVVVNDSLVLVDYINKQRARGLAVFEAVLTSGAARFRPVLLTSITTFAGLAPLLLDFSTQAEFLKPMAISLGFGILFTTAITLIIVPVNYLLAYQAKQWVIKTASELKGGVLEYWHREDVR